MPQKMSAIEAKRLQCLRDEAFKKQGMRCHWCGLFMKPVAAPQDPLLLTGDHVIPLHAGGKTIRGNIVAACRSCNNGRHPEFNSLGIGIVATVGDATPRSPFEVLAHRRDD